jgi:hypothetical protein
MPGRNVCIARQFDLGEAANISPMLQQAAEMSYRGIWRDQVLGAHGGQPRLLGQKINYLRRK